MTGMDTRPDVRELPLAPDGEVAVTVFAGNLRFRGTDEAVVRVRDVDGDPLDEAVTVRLEGGRVVVVSREEGRRLGPVTFSVVRGRIADLEIEVPRTARLDVRTASGDVEATDLEGPTKWTTASGNLELVLGGGSLAFQTVSGDVAVTSSGELEVEAATVSGDVSIASSVLTGLRAQSTSGDIAIRAELAPRRGYDITTVSGDVKLGTDSPVRVETRTVAGDVTASLDHRTEGGKGRRSVIVGDGTVVVGVRTMSGDIRVVPGAKGGEFQYAAQRARRAAEEVARTLSGLTARAVPPAPEPPPAPAPFEVPVTWSSPSVLGDASGDRREVARLEILRALERGDLDIDAASRRLEALEDAGPRAFRGWV